MKQEKFKVVDYIRLFIKSLSFNLENFPKKEYELKERIKKNAYDKYNSIEEKIADNFEYIYSEFCNDDGKDLMIDLFNKIAKDIGIIKYIAPLTMNEKLVVFLYYLATLNGSEIGRKMNKSRQCVNESMRPAIQKIKKEISKNEKI